MLSKILNSNLFNTFMDSIYCACAKYYWLVAAIAAFRYESHVLEKWHFNLKFGFDLFYFGIAGLTCWAILTLLNTFYYKDDEESVDSAEEKA